ncbi:YCII-related domain protein [Mycobacterium xenopi 3993]|nr:YCII-related domain protein [Mycobacterium xenopi 3993]
MQYFALLISKEQDRTLDERAALMTAFEQFHAKAAAAIRAGDALTPPAAAVRITGGPDSPAITDGPFPESAEVACGYYVFDAENLDEALALARDIPVAAYGRSKSGRCLARSSPAGRWRAPTGWLCCWNHRSRRLPRHTGVADRRSPARRLHDRGRRSHRGRGRAA